MTAKNNTTMSDYRDEYEVRRDKLTELRKQGVVYVDHFKRTHKAQTVLGLKNLRASEIVFAEPQIKVAVAGRLMTFREHGKIAFGNLRDSSGEVQLCFKFDILGAERFKFVLKMVDLGDFLGIKGEPFITRQGKLAILVMELTLLSKTLRPLPNKFSGLEDQEKVYRQRYLDLATNNETMERFRTRSQVVQSLRDWLLKKDFLEVMTRTLQTQAGGAMAETFITHHHALDHDFHLRISPELDLKTCVVGGMERVFEFAINFRNEGIDPSHLQEFQMLEWYCAYENFETNMTWTEEMIRQVLTDAFAGQQKFQVEDKDGAQQEVDLSSTYPRVRFADVMLKWAQIDIFAPRAVIMKKALAIGLDQDECQARGTGNLLDDIYKKLVRPKLVGPLFLTHYPADLAPLARQNDADPRLVDTFQLIIAGWEIIKAYSELIDPVRQRVMFEEQMKARGAGDIEAMSLDEEYLTAMEHGMPPITGWGMGIDRFVALLTGQKNLRDTVLFPLMRAKNEEQD